MAKRQRGGTRPGQRAPLPRGAHPAPAPTPATAPKPATAPRPSGSLSEDELERAAVLEAQIVEEERVAAASMTRGRDRRRPGSAGAPGGRPRTVGTLAALADAELVYVVRDLRRIALVFAMIFGLLLASWLLIIVVGVGG